MLKRFLSGLALASIAACAAAETGLTPQSSNANGVKVTVTLQPLSSAAWTFDVTMETHTHGLDDDLTRSALLIANGKRYAPLAWDGSPPGGHHRKGKLRFKEVVPRPAMMELEIRLAGEPAARSFRWQLE